MRRAPARLSPAQLPSGGSKGAASKRSAKAGAKAAPGVRERILNVASTLFYERGARAVGVDLIVQEAAVAKASLYHHFPTKDDLIVAFLEREDAEFWAQWDGVAKKHRDDPVVELAAHLRWIGARLVRSNYRGCPQINVAAEYAETNHPSRQVSQRHMLALRDRLRDIARKLGVPRPGELAAQLAVLVNGAFVSSALLGDGEATDILLESLEALLVRARATGKKRR